MCFSFGSGAQGVASPQGRWLYDVPEEMETCASGFSGLEALPVPQAWIEQPS